MDWTDSEFYINFFPLEKFEDWKLVTGVGIAHPYDPSLWLILKNKRSTVKGIAEIALVQIHAFGPLLHGIWHIGKDDIDARKSLMDALIGTLTIFLTGVFEHKMDEIMPFFRRMAMNHKDGPRTLEYIRAFKGDPSRWLYDEEDDSFDLWEWEKGRD